MSDREAEWKIKNRVMSIRTHALIQLQVARAGLKMSKCPLEKMIFESQIDSSVMRYLTCVSFHGHRRHKLWAFGVGEQLF